MAYSRVKLLEKNGKTSVGVVPTSWVADDRVYWSDSINAQRDRKLLKPVNLRWPSFELVKVILTDGKLIFQFIIII